MSLHLMENKHEDGTTKDGIEYCPYTVTSKKYDTRRVNPGTDIILGNAATSDVPLHEQTLLDVGCGTGSFLAQMKPFFKKVCGVEFNDGMLEQAVARFGSEVPLVLGAAQDIPHPDESFDVVTINQVIHHFDASNDYSALLQALKEGQRVLKPSGRLIISTSTPAQQRDAFWWLSLFPKASEKICDRFPPLETLVAKLASAGLVVDSDGIIVPLSRPLMAPDRYLNGGIDLAFDSAYRACDSSWEMVAAHPEEFQAGLAQIRKMKEDGTADQWLAERETLRRSMGQCTFVVSKKAGELGPKATG